MESENPTPPPSEDVSVDVDGDVSGQVAIGEDITQIGDVHDSEVVVGDKIDKVQEAPRRPGLYITTKLFTFALVFSITIGCVGCLTGGGLGFIARPAYPHPQPPPTVALPPPATSTRLPTSTPSLTPTGTPGPRSLRLETIAIPGGWMSGGDSPTDFIRLEYLPDGCHTDTGCSRVTYQPGGEWGGILWWPHGCTWDMVSDHLCTISVLEAGDFSAVYSLSFWARGERGGEKIEFRVGSEPGDIPPTPSRSLGTVMLGATWQQYEIDLRDVDLSNAIALFYWGASDANNPRGAVFYLDDIQFEGIANE